MIDTAAILSRVNLSELIEQHAEPSKVNGRVFCPFCQIVNPNSPALSIHDKHWHCFGCGAGGDAVDFIMQLSDVDFLEAARRLGWDGT